MIEEKLLAFANISVTHQASYAFVLKVKDVLAREYAIQKEAEIEMFLTHLAVAYLRQANNDVVTPMCLDVRKEIINHPLYSEAVVIWENLEQLSDMRWQENERDYIHAHLIAMLIEE